jgi:hopanoid biosynthesis associated protein HpnK
MQARAAAEQPVRRLIVNADDFGRSPSINEAVIRAYREGVLTTASLMVNEPAASQATDLSRAYPALGVGLHLSLVCGRSALGPKEIPALVNGRGEFGSNPVSTGVRYFGRRGLRVQLRQEIRAQIERFQATGLTMDHLNGHLHLHLHPVIFDLLMEHAAEWGIKCVRLTREPFWLTARQVTGHWAYRVSHAVIFRFLARRASGRLRAQGIGHTDNVFGLLQDGRVDEPYLLKLLPVLPPGDSELYAHPSLDDSAHELAALISPRVRALMDQLGLVRIRYADL